MSLATLFRYKSLDAIPGRSRTVITVSSLLVLTLGILSSVFLVRLPWRGASVQAAQTGLTVVSAASFSETALAPESLAAAFGAHLATVTALAQDTDAATPGVQLPTSLGGTYVKIKGVAAPLLFVSPQQVNFVVPSELPISDPDPLPVEIKSADGQITTGALRLRPVAPAIFTFDSSGGGLPAAYLVRVKDDQTQTLEPLTTRDATGAVQARAVDLGAAGERIFLVLYLSGIRRAVDDNRDGNLNDNLRVLLNGYEITPSYAGPTAEYVGLEQINCEIPRSFLGNQKLTVRVSMTSAAAANNQALAATSIPPVSNLTEILLAIPPVTQAQWRAEGMPGADIHALLSAGETMYLGTSLGIYRTVDDGVNFVPVNYALPFPAATRRTFALAYTRDQSFRAGTDGNGIWTTHDGETWLTFESDAPLNRERVLSLAANAAISFAGTDGNGVYRSLSSAPRWQTAGLAGQKITALALGADRLFAASASQGLQVTTNEGQTWQSAGRGLPAGAAIHTLAVRGAQVFVGTSAGLWRSTDNGNNWAELKLNTSGSVGVTALLFDNNNWFAGTDGAGIFVSNNGGNTWKALNDGLSNLQILSLAYHAGRLFAGTRGGGVFATVMVANSNLPPTAEAQTITLDEDTKANLTLAGSDPNGDALKFRILSQPRNGTLSGEAPHLTYTPINNFNGTDSFTFITQDGQTASRYATVTLNIRPVDDPPLFVLDAPKTSIVGGLIIVSVTAYDPDREPVTLTATSVPTGTEVQNPYPGEPRLVAKLLPLATGSFKFSFAASQGSQTLTREASVTVTEPQATGDWAQMPLFLPKRVGFLQPVVEADGSTTLYALAMEDGRYRFDGLYRATNSRNWTRLGAGLPPNLIQLPRLAEGNGKLYFQCTEGVFRSTDKGETFVNITRGKGLPNDGKQMFVYAQKEHLFVGTQAQLFRSLDAGETWQNVTGNLPAGGSENEGGTLKSVAVSGPALIASLSSGIQGNGARTYRSLDNGRTWNFVNADDAISLTFYVDGENVYGLSAFFLHRSDDYGATWPVLNPLFEPPRNGQIVGNSAVAVRNSVVMLEYSDGRIFRSADKGQSWKDITGNGVSNVFYYKMTPEWIYALTYDGLVFARPNR